MAFVSRSRSFRAAHLFCDCLRAEHFTTNGAGIGSFTRLSGSGGFRHNPIIADVCPFVRFFSAGTLMPMILLIEFPFGSKVMLMSGLHFFFVSVRITLPQMVQE